MAQAISNLALGSKVWISDNGVDELYEIAGFDVHGAETVTLVKTNISDIELRIPAVAESQKHYEDSMLDVAALDYRNRFSARHRATLKTVAIICAAPDGTVKEINRPVFSLSYTEVGGSAGEGIPLPLYSSNDARKKTGGSLDAWWLRSARQSPFDEDGDWYSRAVLSGGTFSQAQTRANLVPAFVFDADIEVSDTTAGDGYVVYFPDAEAVATPVSPLGEYMQVDKAITFKWVHSTETGTAQTRADIQQREYGGAWQDLLTVTGVANMATLPAYTFSPGRFYWRVRTYNEDGVPGPWSSAAAFVCVGAPAAPSITSVEQTNRPAVAWESSGQIGYQVQIGEYDTGEVGGQAKTHKIPYYIPNGTYAARIRIKGASLLWSAWAEQEFSIDVTGPAKPTLTAEAITGAAHLTFTAADAEKLYLLRDGIPIANVTGKTEYTDHAAQGSAVYILRAVDASDNYTDSDPVGVTVAVSLGMVAALAAVDDLAHPVALKLTRGGPRMITGSKSRGATYHHYAGREYPVARYSGHSTGSYELSVAFLSANDRDRLLTLLDRRRTMLYRDKWGNRWYVAIPDNGYEQDRIATSLTLTMQVVDYVEQIEYEV